MRSSLPETRRRAATSTSQGERVRLAYLLDTNIISAGLWPVPPPHLVERLNKEAPVCAISSTTWHELMFGLHRMPPSRRRDAVERYLLEVVLCSFQILPYERSAAAWHGKERARLQRDGQTAPFADGQIAAVATVNDLVLVTDNTRDFERFLDLTLENWLDAG